MNFYGKKILRALATVLIMAPITQSYAQGYPSHSIRLVVPFAAGSAADIFSRVFAKELNDQLGQAVVVENKPGAGGSIGTAYVAHAAPDGYTLALVAWGSLIVNQVLYPNPGYNSIRDFSPIAVTGGMSNIMVVRPDSPFNSVEDVVTAVKRKPSESYSFSSSGVGTAHHIAGVLFGDMIGTKLLHVPYKGAPQGLVAIMNRDVDMGFYNIPVAMGLIRGKKLKPLAVTTTTRSPLFPQVPTLDESGLKGYTITTWLGFVAPAGTPSNVISRLHGAFGKILAVPTVRETLKADGFDVASLPLGSTASFEGLIRNELIKWTPIVKSLGAKAN